MTNSSKKSTAASKKTARTSNAAKSAKPEAKKTSPAKAPAKRPAAVKAAAPAKTASKEITKAPAKKPVKKTSAKPAAKKKTTVSVDANVGFGNQLFIRGDGPGLSWDRGVPMTCVDASHWEWSTNGATKPFVFKMLINDQLWSQGEDFEVQPGEHKTVRPDF